MTQAHKHTLQLVYDKETKKKKVSNR